MNENDKVVDITDVKAQTEGNVENQDKAPEKEIKQTIFGKIDQKILSRREAKAKKKAEKKPMDKGKKVAIIGGGVALSLGILGAVGKAALNAAAKYADDPEVEDGYPSEDLPEPTEVEVETQEATNEEET